MENRFFKSIKTGLADICYIWRKEYVAVFRDVGAMLFFFALPFAYPLLYAFIYNTEVVYDVPLAVVDNSRTQLSREMCRRIDASPNTEILSYCANLDEAKELMYKRRLRQEIGPRRTKPGNFLFRHELTAELQKFPDYSHRCLTRYGERVAKPHAHGGDACANRYGNRPHTVFLVCTI